MDHFEEISVQEVLGSEPAPIEVGLDASPARVVIQYRKRGLPWYVVAPLFVAPAMAGMFLYHKTMTEIYRRRALQAEEALGALQARIGQLEQVHQQTLVALTTPPAVPDAPRSGSPPTNQPANQPDRPAPDKPVPPAGRQPEPIDLASHQLPPTLPSEQPSPKTVTVAPPLAQHLLASNEIQLPSASAPESSKPAQSPRPAEPAAIDRGAALPPLPTREQALLEIEQESRALAQNLHEQTLKHMETIQSINEQEQIEFREALLRLLRLPRHDAALEINRLVRLNFRGVDSRRLDMARSIWSSRSSRARRIDRIRALGLPESVILNLISDDLHALVRTRNGPRDEDDVRVRAVKLLLSNGYPSASRAVAQASNVPQPTSQSVARDGLPRSAIRPSS